jgi:hypothetical protein
MKLTKDQEQAVDEIKAAVVIAREVFNTKEPTAEMVFGMVAPGGIVERVMSMEDEEAAHKDLLAAAGIARELFSAATCDTSAIFGVFDHVFVEYDEEAN